MQQSSARMVIRVVNCQMLDRDVVLYQMLFVVQMVIIAARMAIPVNHQDNVSRNHMSLSYSRRNPLFRWIISVRLLAVWGVYPFCALASMFTFPQCIAQGKTSQLKCDMRKYSILRRLYWLFFRKECNWSPCNVSYFGMNINYVKVIIFKRRFVNFGHFIAKQYILYFVQ